MPHDPQAQAGALLARLGAYDILRDKHATQIRMAYCGKGHGNLHKMLEGHVMKLLTAALLLLFLGERVGLLLRARREGCHSMWLHAFAWALTILVLAGMR